MILRCRDVFVDIFFCQIKLVALNSIETRWSVNTYREFAKLVCMKRYHTQGLRLSIYLVQHSVVQRNPRPMFQFESWF